MSVAPAAIEASALSIGYRPRGGPPRVVASNIDLTLRRGELVCVLGPNGAGKSTFLRTVSGLQAPLEGRVTLHGRDVHRLSALERARGISVVLTERITGGMFTSYDIVSLGRQPHTDWRGRLTEHDHAIVRNALIAVGAVDLAARPVAELSDGERQRVMVGRALAQQPQVMILDEITAFLDLPRRLEVMRLLRELAHRHDTAVLLSTHDLDLALRTADQLWVVAGNGRVECGGPEDLVLAGTIERTFASGAVSFDQRDGTFRPRDSATGAVTVHGDGIVARWTAHAVERAGFRVAHTADESGIHVHAPAEQGPWRLRRGHQATLLPSLQALVAALREGQSAGGVATGAPPPSAHP